MKNLSSKAVTRLMACLLITSAFSALVAGCGKKEEAPSGGNGYYSGTLKTKNGGAAKANGPKVGED